MNTDNIREAFEAEKKNYAYEGKPLTWQQGFTKGFHEGYQAVHAASEKRIAELKADVKHWKNNHAHEVERARLIKNRPDVPLDREKAYDRCSLDNFAALQADNKRLVEALQKIANIDYRGNRSTESVMAYKALSESLEDK